MSCQASVTTECLISLVTAYNNIPELLLFIYFFLSSVVVVDITSEFIGRPFTYLSLFDELTDVHTAKARPIDHILEVRYNTLGCVEATDCSRQCEGRLSK